MNTNPTLMTWNLLRTAKMIRDAGGRAAHGNRRSLREARCRFDHPDPECRQVL